jgi:UDP-N-acetylglucosamine--N-acetylmuramyl-(pentapeptide) pyrophosphoryl-undecaprenol N-acetylglucosamine transferase
VSVPSLLLAGGGSAGHTSPLIATAYELSSQRPDLRLTALGTARGLETTVIPAAGLSLELIPPVPMPRQLSVDLALVGPRLLRAVHATISVLRRVEAQAVLGFGGYVATPAYLAARRLGLPIVVHEQNTMPGLANRLAARLTGAVYTAFPTTPLPHATCIGLPMRRGITELDRHAVAAQARTVFDLPADTPVLLVSGGSQGAASINRAVLGARERLLDRGISVLHVLGPKNMDEQTVRAIDPSSGAVYVPVAFVEQMEQAYAVADLMLGRCGAGTVMETAAVGLPAVFVPYPHGNGEQARNAELVVEVGGGLLLNDADCTSDWVATEIPTLIEDQARRKGMREALAGVARTDAAAVLAARTLEVIGEWA